jgi:hypothetical protein
MTGDDAGAVPGGHMAQILIQPADGPRATRNLQRTIRTSVEISEIESLLLPDQLRLVREASP